MLPIPAGLRPPLPSPELAGTVMVLGGSPPIEWLHVRGGHSAAERWRVILDDETRLFVKAATSPETAACVRAEHDVYGTLREPFMPRLRGYAEGSRPVLVTSDLGAAGWPPPWEAGHLRELLDVLDRMRDVAPPASLPAVSDQWRDVPGWSQVAADPHALLATGLCGEGWLQRCIGTLAQAAAAAHVDGAHLVHLDVRADNVCFTRRGPVLVDWTWASRGNPDLDLVTALVSAAAGGASGVPVPGRHLGPLLALLCGFWAARLGNPIALDGPSVQAMVYTQLSTALPWCAAALDLPAAI